MKTKFNGILTLLLAFMVQLTFAQERTISGVVSDDLGPVSDISVKVRGTDKGTVTDFDGNYTIKAKTGDVIDFTHVSYNDTEKIVGASNTIDIVMNGAGQDLDVVIVTAQGIKKEKKALGYAISEVKAEEIENRSDGDVARVLSGKASGVQITSQSGLSGSATSVVIRGYSSINGSNQALFIVDGVPFSSDNNTNGSFAQGNVGSSRFLDIDPNNIESINVLKGLAAATLYGSAGRNGVILITTKTGTHKHKAGKNEVSVSQSFFLNKIASTPDYQQKYGNGFNQSFGWFFSNWGPAFNANGVDGYLNDPIGLIDANGTVEHPYSSANSPVPEFIGQRYDYKPYNSVDGFFNTGQISNTSINFGGSSDNGKISYNSSVSLLDEKGFTPGNALKRLNVSLGGRAKLNNKFTVNATFNFANTDFKSPPVGASLGNGTQSLSVFANVFFTPISVDLNGLPFELPNGGSIYYRNGNDIINPRWVVKNAGTTQDTKRFFSSTSLSYEINDKNTLTYRVGLDFYNENTNEFSNKNGVSFDRAINGFLDVIRANNTIWDHYLALNSNYSLTDNIGMSFIGGVTSRSTAFDRTGVSNTEQIAFGTLSQFNFRNQSANSINSTVTNPRPIEFHSLQNIIGAFAEFGFDYNNYLYLTLSGRKDWVSNLPSKNNSIFYPSVSASFIPTAAFDNMKSTKGLNYLKFRMGLGQSAGFPENYPTVNTLAQNTEGNGGAIGAIVTNTVDDTLANEDLKPELFSEFEVGFDSKFLNNKVSLDVSYFKRKTTDLIVASNPSVSSGFTSTTKNVGEVQGSGWEVDLGVDLFRSKKVDGGFNWNSRVNFTTSESIVTKLDQDQIIFSGFSDRGNAAIEGEPLGVIVGSRIERDDNGNFVVNAAGVYKEQGDITLADGRNITPIIGDPNPDYIMNFTNTLSFKNFDLGFQINHTKGGDIYSSTIAVLYGRGLIVDEERNNTYILPGVQESTGLPNNVQINNSRFYFSNFLFGTSEARIYDASVVRLQELSLAYNFNKKLLDNTPLGSLSIKFSGNNLWYDAYNTPDRANFDPNVAGLGVGNGRGFDFINGPSTKRYGISVKASF